LVLAANAAWAGLASRLPYWDEVISIDVPAMRSDLAYRLRLLASLSRRRFAVALHPTHSRSILYGDSVIRTTRAAERIGSTGDLANISITQRRLSDRWYTRLVPTTNEPLAEIDRHYGILAGTAKADMVAKARELLSVPATEPDEDVATDHVQHCPCCGGHMVVIETFAPGTHPSHCSSAPVATIRIDTS